MDTRINVQISSKQETFPGNHLERVWRVKALVRGKRYVTVASTPKNALRGVFERMAEDWQES